MKASLSLTLLFAVLLSSAPAAEKESMSAPAAVPPATDSSVRKKTESDANDTPAPTDHATAAATATQPKALESSAASAVAATPAAPLDPTAAPATQMKGMARDFGQQSRDLLARHKELTQRLKSAQTHEERAQIRAEMEQYRRQRAEQQRQLARNLRDQIQATRAGDGVGAAISK